MSKLTRRSLLASTLAGAATLPFLAGQGRAYYHGGGQAASADQAAPAAPAAPTAANRVVIQGMAFAPAALTVAAGTTVTFANQDSVAHTVTADSGAFDQPLEPGQTVQITFPSPSTYAYHCEIHPSMRGTISVA